MDKSHTIFHINIHETHTKPGTIFPLVPDLHHTPQSLCKKIGLDGTPPGKSILHISDIT